MRFLILTGLLYGGYALYNKYVDHMNEFNKDRFLLKQEKVIYKENEVKNKTFEDNISKVLQKVKAKNEKIETEPKETGVDFSDGNHILTI